MNVLQTVSVWAVPAIVLVIPLVAYVKGVPVYEAFCEGAKDGFDTAVRILPYLVAMFVAIGVLRASGAFGALMGLVDGPARALGIPPDIVPLAFLRPLSGSGALGYLGGLLESHGPDSFIGLLASTMQGSTETTFYIITVYFGAVGVTRARHAVVVGLLADLAGFVAAVVVCSLAFSSSR